MINQQQHAHFAHLHSKKLMTSTIKHITCRLYAQGISCSCGLVGLRFGFRGRAQAEHDEEKDHLDEEADRDAEQQTGHSANVADHLTKLEQGEVKGAIGGPVFSVNV